MVGENVFAECWRYMSTKQDVIWSAMKTQIYLTVVASLITTGVGVPLGIVAQRIPRLRVPVIGGAGVLYTIPILAMFGFLIPLMGIGNKTAMVALVIYGVLPILQNTYTGINEVNPFIKEAAKGMGASSSQMLFKVEIPMALPVILAGIRTSVVMNVSVATFAVFIGAGGMGTIIVQGMRTYNSGMLLAGTLLVAILAVLVDRTLGALQARLKRSVQ